MDKTELEQKYLYKIIRIINKVGCEGVNGRIGFCCKISDEGTLQGYWGCETLNPGKDVFEIVDCGIAINSKGGVFASLERAIRDFLRKALYQLDIDETNPALNEIVSALYKGLLYALEGRCDLPMYGSSVCDKVEEEWLRLTPELQTNFFK